MIRDLKTLNRVQQLTDEQILGVDEEEFRDKLNDELNSQGQHGMPRGSTELDGNFDRDEEFDDDEDDDDDFEQEMEKYVPFAEKLRLAEQIKSCSKECLTEVVKHLLEEQPSCIDDYGNSRIQLKIDLIEREPYLACVEIYKRYYPTSEAPSFNKRQKTSEDENDYYDENLEVVPDEMEQSCPIDDEEMDDQEELGGSQHDSP